MLIGCANPAATTASLTSSLVILRGATPHTPVALLVLMHFFAWLLESESCHTRLMVSRFALTATFAAIASRTTVMQCSYPGPTVSVWNVSAIAFVEPPLEPGRM